jgi:osmotically-inducible protein OsmY
MKWLEDVDAEELATQFKRLSRTARERVQEEVDLEEISKQLSRLSTRARKRLENEIERRRPPKRRFPWALVVATGVGVAVGVYLATDAERRRQLREGAGSLYGQAREKMPKVADRVKSKADEATTKAAVEAAILSELGSPPGHLDVEVEGRTVYLRGRVEEPGFVDRAVEVARGVEGVAAVINLTVEPESSPASSAIEL